MKRIISVLLILVLCALPLFACSNNQQNDDSTDSSGTDSTADDPNASQGDTLSEWKNADGKFVPKAEVKNMNGREFTIIVVGDAYGTYQSDDFTFGDESSGLYGELLDDAVKERNNMVEQLYNVELHVVKSNTIDTDIANDIGGNLGEYDAIMPYLRRLAVLATENSLVDLTTIEGFDINAPWYDEHATEAFSVNNSVYFTTGDITILNKVGAPSILFNKSMIETYHLEVPYKLVTDKQWTFDKMIEMGKSVASTTNSDPFMNTYGMLTSYGDMFVMFGASGEKIVVKDENDLPILNFTTGNERAINIAQNVLEEFANCDDWAIFAQNPAFASNVWVESLRIFSEGHALFRPSYFSATTKLRKNSDIVFGILPHPLMDSTQTEYVSYCGTGSTAGIAIPKSASDYDFSAYMIDAYSAWAKNTITHAYYDVNLYQKDTYDQDSVEMLDIIFAGITYDMGECYNFGTLSASFTNLVSSRSTDIVSQLDAVQTQMESQIDELRENLSK